MRALLLLITGIAMCLPALASDFEKDLELRIRDINNAESIEEQINSTPLEQEEKEQFLKHFKELEIKKLPTIEVINKKLNIQSAGPRPVNTLEFRNPTIGRVFLNGYELKRLHTMGVAKRIAYIRRVLRKTSKANSASLSLFPKAYADTHWLDKEAPVIGMMSFLNTDFQEVVSDLNKRFGKTRPLRIRVECNKHLNNKDEVSHKLTVITRNDNKQNVRHDIHLTRDLTQKEKARKLVKDAGRSYGDIAEAFTVEKYRVSKATSVALEGKTATLTVTGDYETSGRISNITSPDTNVSTNSYCEDLHGEPKEKCHKEYDRTRIPFDVKKASKDLVATRLITQVHNCCHSKEADSCSREISMDEDFGLDSPSIKKATDSRGNK